MTEGCIAKNITAFSSIRDREINGRRLMEPVLPIGSII
jgi:hypothetical protein